MARRTKEVTIIAEGRDKGKLFVLKELPATKAEYLALQAMQLLIKSGAISGDDEVSEMGMQGLAIAGFQALGRIDPFQLKPLLEEMMTCVQGIKPDPVANPSFIRPLTEDDIEEISTMLTLRMEIFSLHTGFSMPVVPSTGNSTPATAPASSNTRTSRPPSAPSSRHAVRR